MAGFVYDLSCAAVLLLIFLNGRKEEFDFTQKVFDSFVISVQIFLLLDGLSWLCQIEYTPISCFLETIFMSILFLFQGIQGFFWAVYEECYLLKKDTIRKSYIVIFVIQVVSSSVFVIANLFTGCLFYVTVEEGYVHGSLYLFNYICYAIYFIIAIRMGIKISVTTKDKATKNAALLNLLGVGIVLICFILQFLFPGVNLVSPSLAIVILMLYLSLQKKHLEDNKIRHIKNLEAKTFGNFDIFYKGQSIKFKRTKSKELIAYLIDRKGASVTLNQLYVVLWDKDYIDDSTKSLLRNIISDIKQTFETLKIEGFFIKEFNECRINPEFIYCDYYEFLESPESYKYPGEYMSQYSWAETTAGYLERFVTD